MFTTLDPYLAILLARLTTLAFAVPSMTIIFRLRAAYLAVGTWVLAEVMMLGAGKIKAFGVGLGISLPISVVREFGGNIVERFTTIYWMAFMLAVVAMGATCSAHALDGLYHRHCADRRRRQF